VRDESPEVQGSIDDPDSAEVLQPPDVYQRLRSREPQVHEGDQALPSCDHAGPFALVQHVQRLVHRSGPVVVEHRRLHDSFSRAASSDGGEMGVASMWIDHWKAASTAEATAAYTGMVPLSPTPLTPSRLSGLGDVMWWTWMSGTSNEVGRRYSASVTDFGCPLESNSNSSSNTPPIPCATPPRI